MKLQGIFNFILYIMITKFRESHRAEVTLEFERSESSDVCVTINNEETGVYEQIILTEDNLFSLIGQLLRIQSEIKKEVSNG